MASMKDREVKSETDFKKEVEAADYLYLKMGQDGLPDRVIFGPGRFVLFIEFKSAKRPSKSGAKRQAYYRKILQRMGFNAKVATTVEEARKIFQREIRASAVRSQKVPRKRNTANIEVPGKRTNLGPRPGKDKHNPGSK